MQGVDDQERQYEVSSHVRWHQQPEHPQRAGRAPGQTDCRVQRPLHSHRDLRQSQWCVLAARVIRGRDRRSLLRRGVEVVGSAGAHRAPRSQQTIGFLWSGRLTRCWLEAAIPCICATGCGSPDWRTSCRRCARGGLRGTERREHGDGPQPSGRTSSAGSPPTGGDQNAGTG